MAVQAEVKRLPAPARKAPDELPKGFGQAPAFQGFGPERPHRPSGLTQALPRETEGVADVDGDLARFLADDLPGGLQLHGDGRQAVGESVVDVTGQAVALLGPYGILS